MRSMPNLELLIFNRSSILCRIARQKPWPSLLVLRRLQQAEHLVDEREFLVREVFFCVQLREELCTAGNRNATVLADFVERDVVRSDHITDGSVALVDRVVDPL